MSRILILGGTRFVGRLVATRLAKIHDVTVLSRNETPISGARRVVAERSQGVAGLRNESFDVVLDFIAYDEVGVADAFQLAPTYLAISSAWLPRLNGARADEAVPPDDSFSPADMPAVTRRYLLGKARLEQAIFERRAAGHSAAAIRLPILMGAGDHTGRLEFYRSRMLDGGPVLLVNGGRNCVQVLWSDDAARVLVALVESDQPTAHAIWEGLPDDGRPVAEFVATISQAMRRSVDLIDVPADVLDRRLSGYLDEEPLWRESATTRTSANLFAALNISATPPVEWLAELPAAGIASGSLRANEIIMFATGIC